MSNEANEAGGGVPEAVKKQYWFYASDEDAEELFGAYPTKAEAIAQGTMSFFGTRFVVIEGSAKTEEHVDGADMAQMLAALSERFLESFGGSDDPPFEIPGVDEARALLELRAWLKRWCAPEHITADGEALTIAADGKEIMPKVELVEQELP